VRLQEYSKLRTQYEGIGGAFLADVQQWPGTAVGSGPLFPTQLTHGSIVSWQHQRLARAMEHVAAQGFHVYPVDGCSFQSPLRPALQEMTESSVKKLSGNGWCLPVLASWMLYVWANCVRKPQDTISREPSPAQADESDDGAPPEEMDLHDITA